MLYLWIVSLIWAFSFGLIKNGLAGVDSNFVAAVRLGISFLVFLPFFRPRALDRKTSLKLLLCGAVQYGGMYIFYLQAFHFLKAYEVALFTLFTPLYVTLLNDLLQRRINWISLGAVGLTMAGCWVVQGGGSASPDFGAGFWIVQASNLCFAFGQIYYRRLLGKQAVKETQIYATAYLGGLLAAGLAAGITTPWTSLTVSGSQWLMLAYLGAIASGLGFFLWNVGARKVNAGTLAIFNDLKVPLAVVVSLLFFGESVNLANLVLGGSLALLALLVNEWGLRKISRTVVTQPAQD
jgi:drug/metabolite transporter (DMT)-like permease